MAEVNKLIVASNEQLVQLSSGYIADIKYDYVYKRWYYDLYRDEELVAAGISLTPNCPGLKGIEGVYIAIIEDNKNKVEYEPFSELGNILTLVEVVE